MTQLHPMAERLLAGMRPQLIALPGYPPGWFARFLDRERDALLAEWSPILFQFFPVPAAPAAAPAPAPAAPAYSLEDARVRAFQDLIVEQTADAPMTAYQFAVKRRSERQGFVEGGEDTAGTLAQMRALAAQGRGQWVGDGFRGIRPASQTTGSARFAPTAELPKPAENAEPLRFERCGSSLCVAVERRLNGRRFNDYLYLLRDVLRGSYREEFNGMTNVQVFPLDQAHRVYEELVKAGWAPRGSAVPMPPSEAVASTFTAGGEGSAAIYGVVKPRIKLVADGGSLKVSLADMLGGEAYQRYNTIVKDAQGTPLEKEPATFLVDPEEAVAMVAAMHAAGWEVEGSQSADGLLQYAVQRLQQEAKDYADRERAAARFIDERVRALQARRGIDVAAYQREGALWLASHHGAVLADQMGLGKTLQVLLSAPPGRGIVVLGPVAAKRAFREDVPKFRRGLGLPGDPDLKLTFLDGVNSFRWAAPNEIVVGSWATMPAAGTAPSPPPGTILVADEAHLLKNPKATRTHQFRALAAAVLRDPAGHVYELTGSPFKNPREGKFVAKDLWEVLQNAQLGSGIFGTQKRFEALRGTDKGNKLLAKGMLRRTRETVGLDKVGLTHQVVKIDVTAEQKREFDKFNEFLDDFLAAFIEKSKELAAARKKVVFAEISKARKMLASAKIPEMLAQVEEFEEQDEPLLVFSMHTDPIKVLAKRDGWAVITGETSQAERDRIVTAFQAGQYKGLGLTIGAGGTSLNLSRAHNALFVDHDWTPSGNEQAEYRMLRYTQEHDCVARVLVMNHPLDLRVEDLLTSKQKQIKRTVDAVSAAMSLNQKPVAPEAVALAAPRQLPDLRLVRQGEKPGEEGAEERPQIPRPARTALERWAERAVLALTDMDPDHAKHINGAGWNKMDGSFGASLASQVQSGGLTDKQWEWAIRICRKYHGQVGAPPKEGEDGQAAAAPAPAAAAALPAPRPAAALPAPRLDDVDARARGFVTDMRGEQGRSAILMAAPPAPPALTAAPEVSAPPAPALRAATRTVLARWADLQRQLDKDLTTQENRLRELSGQRTTDVVERARATASRLLGEAQRLKQVVTLLSAQGNAGTLPRPLEGLGNRIRLTGLLAAQTAGEVPEEDKRAWEALRSALYWRQGDLLEFVGPGGVHNERGQQARVLRDTPREETLLPVRPLPAGMNTTWRAADVRFVAPGAAAAALEAAAPELDPDDDDGAAVDDAEDLAAAAAAAEDAAAEDELSAGADARYAELRRQLGQVRGRQAALEKQVKALGPRVWHAYRHGNTPSSGVKAKVLDTLREGPEGLRALRRQRALLEAQLVETAPPLSQEARAALRFSPTKLDLLRRIVAAGTRGLGLMDQEVRPGNLALFVAAGFVVPSAARPGAYAATDAGRGALARLTPAPLVRPALPQAGPAPEGPAVVRLSPGTAALLGYAVGVLLRTPLYRARAAEFGPTPGADEQTREALLAFRAKLAGKGREALAAISALDHEIATGTPAVIPPLPCDFPTCSDLGSISPSRPDMVLCPTHEASVSSLAEPEVGLPTPPEGWPASPGLRWEKEGALWKPVVVPLTAGLTLAQAFAPGDQVVTGYGTSGTVATVGQDALLLRSERRGRSGGTIGNLEALASGAARSPREAVADPGRELAINAVDDFVVRTSKEALDAVLRLPVPEQSAALKALARRTLETLAAGPRVPTLAPGELVVIPDGIRALHGLSVGARLGSGSYSFTEPDAILRRLQRDGLVVSQVEPLGGPHETTYTLTDLGRAQLAAYPLIQVLDDEDLRLLRVLAAAPGPWPVEENPTNERITRRLALAGLILRGGPSKRLPFERRPARDYECTAAGRALLVENPPQVEPECHKVQVFLGQTRDPALMRRLDALGWGEVVQRNELPPRRAPWFFDNGAFRDWQDGTAFDELQYTDALLKLERQMGTSVKPIPAPVFITLPDVPARGAESLALSLHWLNTWKEWPAPLYLVVQDGMAFADIEPHVARLGGIFIGGSVEWKQAAIGPWCAWAHEHGLKCHVGRAANLDTLALSIDAGVDSIDSSLPLWSKENLERFKRHLCPPGGIARTLPAPTAEEERDAEDVAEAGAALDAGGEAPDALDEEALRAWKRNQSVRDRLSEVERKLKLLEDRAKDAGVLDDYLNNKVPRASAKAQVLRDLRAGPEGLDALRARRPELRQQLIEGALPLSPEARDKLLAGMRATKAKRSLLARIVEAGDRGIARTDYDVSDGNLIAFQAAGFLAPSVARPGAFVATDAGRAALVQVTPPPKAPPPPLVVPPTPEGGPAQVPLAPRTAELLRYVGLQLRSQSFMMSPERAAAVELLRDATPAGGTHPRAELLAYREQLVPFAVKGALANAALFALDHEIATGTPAELPRLRCDSPGCGQFTTIDALVRTGSGMEMILCPRHGGPPVRETPPPAAETPAPAAAAGSAASAYVPADAASAPPASEAALRFRDQLGAVLPDLFARSAPLLWPILKSGELPWLIR